LTRNNLDWYTNCKTITILVTLMSSKNCNPSEDTIKFVCQHVRELLRHQVEEKDICTAISAAMKLLTRQTYRPYLAQEDGIGLLVALLKSKTKNIQVLYQAVNCIWLLSYDSSVAEKMGGDTKVIPSLIEVLRTVQKEKVVRMALATLRNLLDRGENNEEMIMYGIQKPLEILNLKTWGDEDIIEDLKVLNDKLEKNIALLSTWEVYKSEVLSGSLSWSTVHKSEKFWRENVHRFEEDNYKLLLILKDLLTSSPNAIVLAVACYDIGEFARFHSRGKVIVQQLGIKLPLMSLMESKDSEVKKHALTAVQKLMVTNWEYLSM